MNSLECMREIHGAVLEVRSIHEALHRGPCEKML